ncbi:MAG: transketolase [Planctomycetota bacterium]|jgi:transketolase
MSDHGDIDTLCINTIRTLSIDAIQKANSGHPGLPLGAAPMAYMLWQNHLKYNPRDPNWPDRDRFVLSAGHGSALLYSLLHLTGYGVTMEHIQNFRQWGCCTPGHPESSMTPGVEATTGPLGQGTANAVGMAIAERMLAHYFNRPGFEIVNHSTYALVSDGDLMEGISSEAASLAGHMHLGKLIYLYDSNDISLDGPTSMTFTEDVAGRYEAYGWQVLKVEDGDTDIKAINAAIATAKHDTSRPSLIVVKTTIGYGSPNKSGKASCHGAPLGTDEVMLTKKELGWDPEKTFFVPDEAYTHFRQAAENGAALHEVWQKLFAGYSNEFPELAKEWKLAMSGGLPDDWDNDLPAWGAGESLATRKAASAVENAIAKKIPWLAGGDADLSSSTGTRIKEEPDFNGETGEGRNVRFGVREHAMASIANGMAYHGGIRPFVSTFFIFSDYMRPATRIAALAGLPVTNIWTHDSIGVGEDGPTHQPVEHLMALRVMPNIRVIRPCDANETREAWIHAMKRKEGPTCLVLSRQGLPILDRNKLAPAENLHKGAYILAEAEGGKPQAIIIATGSEVKIALEAQEILQKDGIKARVVSMPCWETFETQSDDYKKSVLPPNVKARISVEAGSSLGWKQWVGDKGVVLGIERFGASAPGGTNFEKFGFTARNVAELVRKTIK